MKLLMVILIASMLLVSCGHVEKPAVGAGRDTGYTESTESEDTLPAGADTSVPEDEAENGYASYSGTEAGGDLTYTTYKGKKLTDFSFLDGLSRDFFSDTADKTNGSWFCGNTVRDAGTGEVTVIFDRADDVFDALEKYGSVYRKNEDEKVIYITFDCGYETEWTDDVLDVLKEKDVKASFFLNGQYIKTAPELVKRMLDEGHIVGNHGNNHKVMSKLSIEELFYEVESNNELLQEYVPGAPYMKYFRPSYGSCSAWDMALYQAMDLENILYSWAYYDYDPEDQMDPAKALETMKKGLHNGSVLMLHTVGSTNAQVLGDFIDYVRAEGFEIRNIDE
ncbi:MAG: polysaccharide deacetylase family protein [Clostridia bacterium]|nr:polysaccharide deacetylase family protein [Clostridia bacterium]